MSTTVWTNEQLEAITQSGCNLLVAAAAGAGKTAVLVERIIRKITNAEKPLDIDSLLVVTFTNAAAAEMRERIGQALEKALDANPQSEHLQRQLTLLDKASITTLHSFCLNVVKSNFHIIELDPAFRIAEETEAVLMKLDILEELFEDEYEDTVSGSDFYKLLECYGGGRDDQRLQELVLSLFEFVQSHPWPEKWLEEHVGEFMLKDCEEPAATNWGKIIIRSIAAELEGLGSILEDALLAAEAAAGLGPYVSCLEEDLDQLTGLQGILSSKGKTEPIWDELYKAFDSFDAARLPRCGKDADADVQERVKAARKEVKDRISRIKENVFNSSADEIRNDLGALYPLFKELSRLALKFGERYSDRKREKALLDFNDLEHFCLKILVNGDERSSVALELSRKFEEILVDEYQDSNLIQEVIINAISRENEGQPNIFMVGDVKQSIYRFRQARPELFLSKYEKYPSYPGGESLRILLYKNFRSRPEIIKGVNFIFKQIMSKYVGELDYTDAEALNPGAVFSETDDEKVIAGGPVEVDIIDLSGDTDSVDNGFEGFDSVEEAFESVERDVDSFDAYRLQESVAEKLDAIQLEARLVATRIIQLIENPEFNVYDNKLKCYRPVLYKDIVILLRTTRKWADVFSEELSLQVIPVFSDAGSGYFKTIEIQTMLSLLQIIDNPLQDIPLLAVLRSPIFLYTTGELTDIRLIDRSLTFFDAIRKLSSDCSSVLADKCAAFLSKLTKWRDMAQYMSTDELIWHLYMETAYYSYVGLLPGGKQRQANLRLLFEKARQYEDTSYKGLFNFVSFMDRLKSGGGDFGSAKILGENENVVRIMSIHKSKGLEFPIVFVSGCGKRFNLQDLNGKVLLHQDLGFGPDLVDVERRISYPVAPKQAIKYKSRQETLSEEMRILYVAFTRAKEKLIITGAVKDFAKASANWSKCALRDGEKLPEFNMLKAGTFLDWICPSLARHRDGEVIRHAEIPLVTDDSSWSIKVYSKEMIGKSEAMEPKSLDELVSWLNDDSGNDDDDDDDVGREIIKRLDWKYVYMKAAEVPAKLSVTELKRRFNMQDAEGGQEAESYLPTLVTKPAFMDGAKGFTSAEKGTIMHFVMQHLKLEKICESSNSDVCVDDTRGVAGIDGISNEVRIQRDKMVEDEFLTAKEAQTVDISRITEFFRSDLGERMLAADKVRREIPFNIELRASEVYKELDSEEFSNETVLLQGVIDCFFEEGNDLVLLDYKTDYVPAGSHEVIKERYMVQIGYYTKALEAITGKKVKDRYLYLFHDGACLKV